MSETAPILSRPDATGEGLCPYHLEMVKFAPLLRVTALVGSLVVIGASVAAPLRADAPEAGVDPSLHPGDDFFAWANGAWLAATAIPAGAERVSARTEIAERTRRQVAALLDVTGTSPASSIARQVADFRSACLNEAAIERRGLATLAPRLTQIAAVEDRAALVRLLGAWMRADVDPLNWGIYDSSHLLGLAVEMGNHGESDYVAFLLQGGLGLEDRDAYLANEPPAQALRGRYLDYIARLLALAGFDREPAARARAESVLALETAIASSHSPAGESARESNSDNLWTRDDFSRRAPGIEWPAFFAASGLASQERFVVWQPGAVTGAAALVASRPLAAWQDYLRFRELDRHADRLPRAFAEAARAMRPAPAQVPASERAQAATLSALSEEVGRLYTDRYFSPEWKARVERIVANVVATFRHRLEAATWMSPASRTIALAKLDRLVFGVGYPDRRPDSRDLVVDPEDALGNFERLAERAYSRALARLGQPIDRTRWWIAPQTVGAVLLFQQNAYNFPAALLQTPKFDPNASDASNYGAIGAIVGHEVSHFVDTLGADYDASGARRTWWTAADRTGYDAATAPLVEQFSAYRPFSDLAIDGRKTLSENLADLGGLAAAFDAYRQSLGARASDSTLVRRLDREFFIGFARSWRSRIAPEAIRKQVTSNDTHAPEAYRIATVRNLDAWYAAFDVRPGDRLYLAPEQRVKIW